MFEALRSHKLSIIVPVFNEGRNILKNLELLVAEVEPHFAHYEILVISDGSTDETNEQLRALQRPHLRTILLERNRGKGYAVRQGFFEAQGDYILFIDGGMELHPKEIRIFLGLMALYDADIVLGSKRHPQSNIDYPWTRRVLSSIYQAMTHSFFDLDVTDTQVGLKLFKGQVVRAIRDDLEIDRYGFDLEVLALAKLRGHSKMLEAPIRLDYFGKNRRPFFQELLHVAKVGALVLADTIRVYKKILRLRK